MASLVDTCGWIEWLTNGLLADDFAPYMENPAELLVPTTLRPLHNCESVHHQKMAR
jgi:hypothetical protein